MLFTLLLVAVLVAEIAPEKNTLTHAVASLIHRSFAHKVGVFNLFIQCEEETRRVSYFSDLAESLLREFKDITMRVGLQQELPVDLDRHYCLFIVDSVDSFLSLLRTVREQHFNIEGYVLIVLRTFDAPYYGELVRIFEVTRRASIVDVNVVVEPVPGSVLMFTYFPFTLYSCDSAFPVITNRFSDSNWSSDTLFPLKLDNMHGCSLICATWEDEPYFTIGVDDESGRQVFHGIEGKLLEFVAHEMNFTIEFYFMNDDQIDATLDESGLVFDELFRNGTDFVVGAFQYKPIDRDDYYIPTNGYYLSTIIVVLSSKRNKLLPSQKLISPFHASVWCLVLIYFGIGTVIALSSSRLPQDQRDFLLGPNNHTPVYNMFFTALGSGVPQLPPRNFARFLVFIWMVLWLVLRSGYQSAMFYFIKSDITRPLPDSIEDAINEHYRILLSPPISGALRNIPSIQRVSEILNGSEVENFPMLPRNSEKVAIIAPYEYFGLFKKRNRGQVGEFYISKEIIFSYQLSIYLKKSSFLVANFNQRIFEFASIGLLSKWEAVYIDVDWNKGKRTAELPRSMKIGEVVGAINIYLAGVVVCFMVLAGELIVDRFSTRRGWR